MNRANRRRRFAREPESEASLRNKRFILESPPPHPSPLPQGGEGKIIQVLLPSVAAATEGVPI